MNLSWIQWVACFPEKKKQRCSYLISHSNQSFARIFYESTTKRYLLLDKSTSSHFWKLGCAPMLFLRKDSWLLVKLTHGQCFIRQYNNMPLQRSWICFSLLVNCIRASGLTTRVTLVVARGHFFCNWSRRLYRDRLHHMGCAVSCSHLFIWGCIAFVLSHKLCCDVMIHVWSFWVDQGQYQPIIERLFIWLL